MNLAFELNQFCGNHIFFMDTKPNSLIDGLFTKVNYCDEQFTMNGVYLTLPGEVLDAAPSAHKMRIESGFYRALCEIEQEMLRSYLIVRNNTDKIWYCGCKTNLETGANSNKNIRDLGE